jgi:hypothetical protein
MTNEEMMRPYTWRGKTFDSVRVKRVLNTVTGITICLDWGQSFILQCNVGESDALFQEAITTIADALNAPVLATEEVLAGLPKDAKAVLIDDIGIPYSLDWVSRAVIGDGWAWGDGYDVMPYHRIQAFNDPKTADYLRQFTLQGVRRVG